MASQFRTYEEYLDSQLQDSDLYYLEDEAMARQLIELGYRGSSDTLKRAEFEARKRDDSAASNPRRFEPVRALASAGKDLSGFPLLQALAAREDMVRAGKLAVVIFIRDTNHRGQEVSGYIDYGHRLKTDDFSLYFDRKRKLLPRPSDLSFYNWETQLCATTSSPNFEVIADPSEGLLLKNKRDRKIINVNPRVQPGDNSRRHAVDTPEFLQCVIFDHSPRR
jgi:hypothetical protein